MSIRKAALLSRALILAASAGLLLSSTISRGAENAPPAESIKKNADISAPVQITPCPHRRLSLLECFNTADRNNREILVASSNLTLARAAIVIAAAIPNPCFNMVYGWGPAWKYTIAGNGQEAGLTEEIQVAGKRSLKVNLAKSSWLQTAFQLEAVRFSVHNRVRRAYAELVAAHASADLIESQRENAEKLLDIARKRFDAGKAAETEVLQAKLAVMQFDRQRKQSWGRLVQDSAQLSLLLGESPRQEEVIDAEGPSLFKLSATEKSALLPDPARGVPPLQDLLPLAWQERSDLKAALQQAVVNEKALELARAQRLSDPTVGFNYLFSTYQPFQLNYFDPEGIISYLQTGGLPEKPSLSNPNIIQKQVNQTFINSLTSAGKCTVPPPPNVLSSRVPFQSGYQLTVQQEHPIFHQYQGQINQAKAALVQQNKQNQLQRAQIAADIVRSHESLLSAGANIKKFREQVLPTAALVAQLTRRGYESGKMDLSTTLLAQQQFQQLLSSYFDCVVAYQNAWADAEQAVGLPLKIQAKQAPES